MRQVLAKRDENWKKLQQFVLDEHEKIDVMGPTLVPLVGQRRTFRWYIRDGYFVRSPLAYNGIAVSENERQEFEDDFLKRAKERDKRGEEHATAAGSATDAAAAAQATAAVEQTASPASRGVTWTIRTGIAPDLWNRGRCGVSSSRNLSPGRRAGRR